MCSICALDSRIYIYHVDLNVGYDKSRRIDICLNLTGCDLKSAKSIMNQQHLSNSSDV